MQKVYCIVVTYNGEPWLEKCLLSLRNSDAAVHVVVVDNGSTDQSLSIVARLVPDAMVIVTGKNLGFGKANNLGIRYALNAGATHVFLLNQDAWIASDSLLRLMSILALRPSLGIISPWHLDGGGVTKDLYFDRYLRAAEGQYPAGSEQEDSNVQLCDFVNAAAWLMTAECLKRVGGFAPIFYHYGEDVNYCHRARYHGFLIGITQSTWICHDRLDRIALQSATTTSDREYIHFLTHVCNPFLSGFRKIVFLRMTRHVLLAVRGLLTGRENEFNFNKAIALKLLMAVPQIGRTRRDSKRDSHPFLQL